MGTPGLEVSIEQYRGAVVVRLAGHAGVHQAAALDRRLADVLADLPRLVILDLRRLDFIGDPAMDVLSSFRQRLIRQDGRVVLAGASDALLALLDAGGIRGLFPRVWDVETALRRIRVFQ